MFSAPSELVTEAALNRMKPSNSSDPDHFHRVVDCQYHATFDRLHRVNSLLRIWRIENLMSFPVFLVESATDLVSLPVAVVA